MAVLSWQNVGTDFSGVAAMGKVGVDAMQEGFKGISEAFTSYADNKRESTTNKTLAELQQLNNLEMFGEERANLIARFNPENMDFSKFNEAADARRNLLDSMATNKVAREEAALGMDETALNIANQQKVNDLQQIVHDSEMKTATAGVKRDMAAAFSNNAYGNSIQQQTDQRVTDQEETDR
ncbi:MAG: hypothetical protein DRN17_06725, partial [Thermoplasmata archaeon]